MPRKLRGRRSSPKIPRERIMNPGKGLNVLISDNLIDDKEGSDLNNIQFVESGAVSKRFGYEQVGNDLVAAVKGLGSFYTETYRQVIAMAGATFNFMNAGDSSWANASGQFTSAETTFSQARAKLYLWNGTEGGTEWSGTALSRPGTMPKAKFAIFYTGYHIAAGVPGHLNRIYISVSTDASDFTNASSAQAGPNLSVFLHNASEVPGATIFVGSGANYVDIEKDDGDKITGLARFQDALIIFKEKAIFQMTFDSAGIPVVSAVSRSIGCVSHKSIENAENDVFFLSRNGYYVLGNEPNFFNAIRTNELSARVNPIIKTINPLYFDKISSIYHDFRYWSAMPIGAATTNNKVLTYDRRYLGWSKNDNINANSFTTFIDENNMEHLYFGADDEGKVFQMTDTYSDDGVAISGTWTSKAFDFGDFDIYKQFLFCTLLFRQISGTVTIKVYTDGDTLVKSSSISPTGSYGMGTSPLGEVPLGEDEFVTDSLTSTVNVPYRIPLNKKARSLKIEVSNENNNENFILLGITIDYIPFSSFLFPSSNKLY